LTALIDKNHESITQKVDDLANALKVQDARTRLSKVTPIKGDTFENQVNVVLSAIAAGIGDEYIDTRSTVGSLTRSKRATGCWTSTAAPPASPSR